MSPLIEGFLFAWKKNRDYGPQLVADLDQAQMTLQPAPADGLPANHPAWVFSHLNAYHPVIMGIIKGESFDDPKQHPFGMLSKPQQDASLYASKEQLVDDWISGHDQITELLKQADDSLFQQKIQLARWAEIMPTAGIALPYLMFNHENSHLGQLSAWRRIQGLPSV